MSFLSGGGFAMSTQLLIYRTAVPITRGRHGDCSIEASASYGFSCDVNSVPLMAVEFPRAASEYAIVFAGAGTEVTPAATLGLPRPGNPFVFRDNSLEEEFFSAFL